MEELQAARELHTAAERKLAEGTAALDGRFEEVEAAVQVSRRPPLNHPPPAAGPWDTHTTGRW